ncbi:MAG: Uma2 family endonuclease, partial [Chloroflexota bacterium]
QTAIHLDDFLQAYAESPFELINGERILLVPGVASHITTIRAIMRLLDAYVRENTLGQVFTEAPFVLEDKPNWVKGSRVPDVMFYSQVRFDAYTEKMPDWKAKPFILVPDIAIEVVSPNDSYSQVQGKARLYLEDGVQLVWIVDPQQETVSIHRKGTSMVETLSTDDTITADPVLPKFSATVADFFTV